MRRQNTTYSRKKTTSKTMKCLLHTCRNRRTQNRSNVAGRRQSWWKSHLCFSTIPEVGKNQKFSTCHAQPIQFSYLWELTAIFCSIKMENKNPSTVLKRNLPIPKSGLCFSTVSRFASTGKWKKRQSGDDPWLSFHYPQVISIHFYPIVLHKHFATSSLAYSRIIIHILSQILWWNWI